MLCDRVLLLFVTMRIVRREVSESRLVFNLFTVFLVLPLAIVTIPRELVMLVWIARVVCMVCIFMCRSPSMRCLEW